MLHSDNSFRVGAEWLAQMAPSALAPAAARVAQFNTQLQRVVSIDVLRGLVMVIMALDHTRDFFTNVPFATEDVAHTYGALFFTRFITHYCAPVFSFSGGNGRVSGDKAGKAIQQVSWFFLTRGLWLVLLEITIVDFSWTFIPWAAAGVIWILGWSMVCMALLVRLPVRWMGIFGRDDYHAQSAWTALILHRSGNFIGCG